ncbi:MAG: transcriptional repressor LexA [Anaerolineales bacterium]|nr:transcriptional repressor LexA [Anaerolineales bacterium]MCX7607905.1 transcriptional repressor LexA [Anaerolineales bacterium]
MVRPRNGMTERHRKILNFIRERYEAGFPPSIREIGEAVGISSTSVVTYYLKQLAEMGLIERDARFSRAVRPTGASAKDLIRIPILGPIAAGEPIIVPDAQVSYIGDEMDGIDVARSLLPDAEKGAPLFALQVKGDSMIDAMINDGDIVILKPTAEARNGEMVAIWLPERNETTLKYFYKEKDRYRLQPANPTMQPLYYSKDEPLEIKGKVVLVIRKLTPAAI